MQTQAITFFEEWTNIPLALDRLRTYDINGCSVAASVAASGYISRRLGL